jgi:WD40 repeat protein
VFLVVALAAGLLAWQRDRASQEEAAKAAARRLASVADSLRPTDPRTAELLSVAAWRLSPLTESRGALLRALAQPERDTFNDPQTGRDARRFLTDGGRTLVSVAGSRVTTWRVTDHRRLGSYRLPDGMEVAGVSPDARTLGLVGPDGNQLWQPSTDRTVADLRDSPVTTWFAGDGKSYLVTPLEGPGTAALHRIDDSERLFSAVLPGPVSAAAVGAGGRLVAVCPANGSPHLWDASRNKRLSGEWDQAGKDTCGTGSGADSGANMVRLSADGTRLAATSGTAFRVWDIPSGRLLADVASPGDSGFTQADLSRDGRFLATSDDQELAVWRLGDDPVQVFGQALSGTELHGLAWDPGKDGVLRSSDNGTVHTYDLTTVLSAHWQPTPSDTTLLSPDGTTLATATRSGDGHRLELRSTRTGAALARAALGAPITDGAAPLLTFSPDGRALAAADAPDSSHLRLRVWDTASGKVRTSLTLPRGAGRTVYGIALGPGGRTLLIPRVTGDADAVDVWDISDSRAHRSGSIKGLGDAAITMRGDGRLAASAADQFAMVPGRVTGRALAEGEDVTALAFSTDGTRLAVGDSSGRVTLWDGDVRRRMGVLAGTSREGVSSEGVIALAFSPDGHTLAVAGAYGTLQLWDTASQQSLVGALPTPGDPVRSVAFSRDGRTVFTAGQYVPLQSYAVDPAKAVTVICDRTGSGLTETQWRAYVPDAPYRAICER